MKLPPSLLMLVVMSTQLMTSHASQQKLIAVLLDGFRWDYAEKYDLPNFKRFQTKGVRAESMTNDFPTQSYPNYYTIMTGLHAESHGITDNYMYDEKRKEYFMLGSNPEHVHPHWWEGAWPLWVSVEKQNLTGYSFYWPGTEAVIHGIQPTWFTPYYYISPIEEFRSAIKDGVAVIQNGTADYVGIFNELSDKWGHRCGPESDKIKPHLVEIDSAMGELLDLVEGTEINLMVMSDHGMSSVSISNVINITASDLPENLYETILDRGPVVNFYSKDPKNQTQIYKILSNFHPNMTVYKREDIPERWHIKHGKYVPSILAVADLGWTILQPLLNNMDKLGDHGFDNAESDMRGIFYGMGPYFKTGASVKSIHVVDLYNVMCGILGITPRPNNGTIQHMKPLLKSGADNINLSSQIIFGLLAICFIMDM